jgi:hypothetical protein
MFPTSITRVPAEFLIGINSSLSSAIHFSINGHFRSSLFFLQGIMAGDTMIGQVLAVFQLVSISES